MDQQQQQQQPQQEQQPKTSPKPTRPIRSLLSKMKKNRSQSPLEAADQVCNPNSPNRRATYPGSLLRAQSMSELISQKQINSIVNDDLQWQKLKVSMKERGRATTGMRLLAELPLLLQERLNDLDTPPMTEDEDDSGEGEAGKENRRRRSRFLGRRNSQQKERVKNVAACQYRSKSSPAEEIRRSVKDDPAVEAEEASDDSQNEEVVGDFTSTLGVQEQELLNLLDLAGAMARSPSTRRLKDANPPSTIPSAKTA